LNKQCFSQYFSLQDLKYNLRNKIDYVSGEVMTLIGNYKIEEELGAGAMGTVYRGVDTRNQDRVAIKQLKTELAEPDMIERFKREGEALRDLNHPNIVKLLDAIEHEAQHYLVMEYVTGGDLEGLIKKERLPIKEILNLCIDLSDALTRAHKLNIVHRDLKPANMLLSEDGTLRLADFGVAHLGNSHRVTQAGSAVGTLAYIAPEALQGQEVDVRADIWSFGVILFEMIAGQHPFEGNTLIWDIMNGNVPDLEQLAPDAPIMLVDLVYRMLQVDLNNRIPSVRNIGADLESLLQGRSNTSIASPVIQRFDTLESQIITVPKHNLPHDLSAFVGREAELMEVDNLIKQPQNRLITIVAQGGMGKTRLGIQVAYQNIDYFQDGVFLVELAPLSAVDSITSAIAEATGYQFQGDGRDTKQQLLDYLQTKKLLLILDNFEHLQEGASLVQEILKQTPDIHIIVTSRQRLALQQEVIFTIGGMDFPDSMSLDDSMNYSAIQLFVNNAKRVQPSFEIDDSNLESIVHICNITQGMPLGIVLAASWISMLSPDEIAIELQQGIDILEDDVGKFPSRQRSIRVIMDYSWQQMSAPEQSTFMKLTVFRGGFTREAAQTVAGANLRLLMSLVNKAVLFRHADDGRYMIHELLRQYATEHLKESGLFEATETDHAHFYANLLKNQLPLLKGKGQLKAITTIEAEQGNIRIAWNHATDQNDHETIEQMIEGFHLYGIFRSWDVQPKEAFEYTRHQWNTYKHLDDTVNAKLAVRFITDGRDPLPDLESALNTAEAHDDQLEVAHLKRQLGVLLSHHRSDQDPDNLPKGIDLLRSSIQAYEAFNEAFYCAGAMDDLVWSLGVIGYEEERLELASQVVDVRHNIGDQVGLARGSHGVASTQHISEQAIATLEEGLIISQKIGDRFSAAWSYGMLSMRNSFHGELEHSLDYAIKSLDIAESLNIEDVRLFSKINKLHARLFLESDVKSIQHDLKQIAPNGVESLINRPSVAFGAVYTHLFLYARLGDMKSLVETLAHLPAMLSFGSMYIVIVLPHIALWIAESDPETAFIYLEYAQQHQANGTKWMTHSDTHMALYNQLRQTYSQDQIDSFQASINALNSEVIIEDVTERLQKVGITIEV
jgi:serine/threonine protein kinase